MFFNIVLFCLKGYSETLIQNFHLTRLKSQILRRNPGLCEQNSGKFAVLRLDGENERALFTASQSLVTCEGGIIQKLQKLSKVFVSRTSTVF